MRTSTAITTLAIGLLALTGCDTDDAPDASGDAASDEEVNDGAMEDEAMDGDASDDVATTVALVDDPGFAFEPDQATVSVGDTVSWTHEGDAPHTVTAGDGTFESGDLAAGDTFEHTFEEAGTFDYVCDFHPDMTGTVTVEG